MGVVVVGRAGFAVCAALLARALLDVEMARREELTEEKREREGGRGGERRGGKGRRGEKGRKGGNVEDVSGWRMDVLD